MRNTQPTTAIGIYFCFLPGGLGWCSLPEKANKKHLILAIKGKQKAPRNHFAVP